MLHLATVTCPHCPQTDEPCIESGQSLGNYGDNQMQIIRLSRWHQLCRTTTMLKNLLKVAIRNLFRQKTYSLLNLMGLSLGIACTLLLTLHVREELSYDKNFPQQDRIYRVVSTQWSKSAPQLAGEMMKSFPEVASIARFSDNGKNVFHTPDGKKEEDKGYFADSSVMTVFNLQPILGDPFHALSERSAIVLTRSMAGRLWEQGPHGPKVGIQ